MLRTVVVDKVGDADAEQGRLEAGIQARHALALDDALRGVEGGGLGALGFDLCAGRQGDERVAVIASALPLLRASVKGAYVRAMENRPPPAPAKA